MQRLAVNQWTPRRRTVHFIPNQRVTEEAKMNPDLVGPPGMQTNPH